MSIVDEMRTVYTLKPNQMKDWKEIANAYAAKVNAELLWVNETSFGLQYPDGTMQHLGVEDLIDILKAGENK